MSEATPPVTEDHDVEPNPTPRNRIREALRAPGGMRQAMLLTEILSGPMAKRRSGLSRKGASR